MPGPNVEAVVALALCAGGRPKVVEVAGDLGVGSVAARAAAGQILVVAHHGMRDGLHPSPGRIVDSVVSRLAAAVVLVVAEREHGRESLTHEQIRDVLLPAGSRRAVAAIEELVSRIAGDVAGRGNDRISGGGHRPYNSRAEREQGHDERGSDQGVQPSPSSPSDGWLNKMPPRLA